MSGALVPVTWDEKQLSLMRRTVAKDTNPDEFNQFVHICRAVRLDPLRRQVYCWVFYKDDPKKRQMTVVTAIGGYRSIAERTGCYRPDDKAPRYDMGEKNPATNPLGILRAEVTVYKFVQGDWHPVVGEAWWDEYVPLYDGHIDTKKTGWTKMPRIMIAKCAEAVALRRAWPDDFAGLEVEEEVDRRHTIDLTASEMADAGDQSKRLEMIGGGNTIAVDWMDGEPLQRVPVGRFGDQALAFIDLHMDKPTEVLKWRDRNRHMLKEFWALDKDAALALKAKVEEAEKWVEKDAKELVRRDKKEGKRSQPCQP